MFQPQNSWKDADSSIDTFVHDATVMALDENPAMSLASSVHRDQYDTTYSTIGCVLGKAFADDRYLDNEHEPARVDVQYNSFSD